ncbi:MAG: carboxymuconolactone decarboxylase family protein [Zetaproteobacteria bacterium]|nr:MAG: carboxymuconolactone decarboxylase family protein [Zetaproteobacteria bacterium]
MAKTSKTVGTLPGAFGKFARRFPEVFEGYEAMGKAAHAGGPLDAKSRELVKLGMTIGARLEGATHSHVRKALAAGATSDEIRHAAVLAISTLGLPATVMALTWVDDILDAKRRR